MKEEKKKELQMQYWRHRHHSMIVNLNMASKTAFQQYMSPLSDFLGISGYHKKWQYQYFRESVRTEKEPSNIKLAVISEFIKIPTTKSKKVTNMVGTFLSEDSDCLRIIKTAIGQIVLQRVRVSAPQAALEKVDNTVTTFLNEDSNCLRIMKLRTGGYQIDGRNNEIPYI